MGELYTVYQKPIGNEFNPDKIIELLKKNKHITQLPQKDHFELKLRDTTAEIIVPYYGKGKKRKSPSIYLKFKPLSAVDENEDGIYELIKILDKSRIDDLNKIKKDTRLHHRLKRYLDDLKKY